MAKILGVKPEESTAIGCLPHQGFQVITINELENEEAGADLGCPQCPEHEGWLRFMERLEKTATIRGLKGSQERGA